jgi:hypothetical protein
MSQTKRLLKLREAADYCGLPTRYFRKNIGIPPVRLGPHELWDRAKLDAYIDALQGDKPKSGEDWTNEVARF